MEGPQTRRMICVLVDADACPVKEEIYKVAFRRNVGVTIVSNSPIRVPAHPLIERVVVSDGFDAADDWIAERAGPRAVCITGDILLPNRNLVLDHEPSTPWEKKQQMKQTDPAHALKLFIAHNAPPKVVPNAGSSIFFHIWRREGAAPTAGCTTMEKTKLQWLVSQIDPSKRPLYVLLPKAEYEKYRAAWKLP